MPAVSKAQQGLMALCLHSPEKARKPCPSNTVAREYASTKTTGLPAHKRSGLRALAKGHQ